jgi:hypothetical protein
VELFHAPLLDLAEEAHNIFLGGDLLAAMDHGGLAIMKLETSVPKRTEFYTRCPENFLLVENEKSGVSIRAVYDNFSSRRKIFFIKELACEGFIPDEYQWFSDPDDGGCFGLRWLIDHSWLQAGGSVAHRAEDLCLKILLGGGICWVALMGFIVLASR